jgi:hypothetical protein
MATASGRFTTISTLETVDSGPGLAEILATPVAGHTRCIEHCEWTSGLLTQPPVLFGLPPATVEHGECTAFGAVGSRNRVSWRAEQSSAAHDATDALDAVRRQLEFTRQRLESVFATAADLIGPGDIADLVARITERAAAEVRAPRYLLAVRTQAGGELRCHHRGFDPAEVEACAERILSEPPDSLPGSWLVVPVRSHRCDYGRLLAAYDGERAFFPQERELLEVYARYAANALDSATALMEAKRLHGRSSALLSLARALASAGTGG